MSIYEYPVSASFNLQPFDGPIEPTAIRNTPWNNFFVGRPSSHYIRLPLDSLEVGAVDWLAQTWLTELYERAGKPNPWVIDRSFEA